MKTSPKTEPRLTLRADTAAELMTPGPVSIRESATVTEAIALLTDRGYSAAPVIDDAGRPVGVLSRSDILTHERECVPPEPAFYRRGELATDVGERPGDGFQVRRVDTAVVGDVMTPAVFSVAPDTPAATVVKEMLGLKVHRLFVVDDNGVLTGVITPLDVLRHLGT